MTEALFGGRQAGGNAEVICEGGSAFPLGFSGLGDGSIDEIIADCLSRAPFTGNHRLVARHSCIRRAPAWCVCIPMRNEEALLPATLAALHRSINRCHTNGAVVLVANDTTDASVATAMSWAKEQNIDHVIVNVTLEKPVRGAPFARRLAMDIGAMLSPKGALLTTDADTLVQDDWIERNLRHLTRDAELVCGAVDVDEAAIDALHGNVRRCGMVEAAYLRHLQIMWNCWTGGQAPPLSVRAMGASLAITAVSYWRLGGLPTPAVAEDKALAALALAAGCVVVEADDVRVLTSCRIDSRATGGMGDALRERSSSDNPLCDEALVPIAVLRQRAEASNRLSQTEGAPHQFPEIHQSDTPRMRMREVECELSLAIELLASLKAENPQMKLIPS